MTHEFKDGDVGRCVANIVDTEVGKLYTIIYDVSYDCLGFIDDIGDFRARLDVLEPVEQYTLEYEETTFKELAVGELFYLSSETRNYFKTSDTSALCINDREIVRTPPGLAVMKVRGVNVLDTLRGIFDKYSGE